MLREARLILPCKDNDGLDLSILKTKLEQRLGHTFGGFTLITVGDGGWVNNHGETILDKVWIFDIAVTSDPSNIYLLVRIAAELKEDARQDAIYLRLPNGEVHFV